MISNPDQKLWTLIPIYGAALEADELLIAEELHVRLMADLRAHPIQGNLNSLVHFLATQPANLENIERHQAYAAMLEDDMSKSLFYNALFETLMWSESYVMADQIHALIPDKSIRDIAIIELLKGRLQRIISNS